VLLKFALIAGLAKLFGASDGVSMRTGLALAQAGEFGFVLLNLAAAQPDGPNVVQVVLASMVLSMLLAPFIIAQSDKIVMKFSSNEWMMQSLQLTKIASRTMSTNKHVIVCGFGRSGQSLATLLAEEKSTTTRWTSTRTRAGSADAGAQVSYGDAARRESLVAAGIYRASAVVITYADTRRRCGAASGARADAVAAGDRALARRHRSGPPQAGRRGGSGAGTDGRQPDAGLARAGDAGRAAAARGAPGAGGARSATPRCAATSTA
jgi:hypothetical protein